MNGLGSDEQKAAFAKRINSTRNAKKDGFTSGVSNVQEVSIPEVMQRSCMGGK